ncbi:MAG TPA: histidine kinase [Gaiellaceae bacterium]|nr:histidine kinase [Gaiellaceae bacterium]
MRLRAQLRPPLADALLAGAFVAASIAEAVVGDTNRPPVVHALVAGAAMAGLAWRRRFPIATAAAVVLANIVLNPEGQFSTLLAVVLVSFTVGAEAEPPRARLGLAIVAIPFLGVSIAEGLEPSDVAALLVFIAGPWIAGTVFRQRSHRAAEAIARAERLEREHAEATAAAAAEERARIARELHDIVSHSISVIAVQTQAVRRRLVPGQEREAEDLAAVETTARQALAEMRRLFGVLRSDDDSLALAPQPGLGELERLLEQVRASGLPVALEVEGERAELPPGVDLAAYRIVQEGLTNTLRHAGASAASVRLRYGDGELEVVVEDDGAGPNGVGAGGHGLVGIRERVTLYGGSVEAGPGEAGGFRLAARLPTRERT